MKQDTIVVSHEEVERLRLVQAEQPAPINAPIPALMKEALPPPIPLLARISLACLVPFLPLLCLVAGVLRIAFRSQQPRIKHAWTAFLCTLLLISGLLTSAGMVILLSVAPEPVFTAKGLSELDEKTDFPTLPSAAALTSADASAKLKPLVVVLSPTRRLWNRQEVASSSFGAGVLLETDKSGYLFATANHVVHAPGSGLAGQPKHAMIASSDEIWAKADIVAAAPQLDLALVWLPRGSGQADFVQPVADVHDGAPIYVIGHPEGFRYTLSTGIVSGSHDRTVQISAAVSPGNSGGPVYDDRGNLIGIVSSKFDRNNDPNGENLGFAVAAGALLQPSLWTFQDNGSALLSRYIKAAQSAGRAAAAH